MEENDVQQERQDTMANFPVPLENGYAKRIDTESDDFSAVVEDIVFLW